MSRPRPLTLAAAAIAMLVLSACENDDPVLGVDLEPGEIVSYQRDIAPILGNNCAVSGCHDSVTRESQMDLSDPFDPNFGAVGVASLEAPALQRINPGSAALSYLVAKLEGRQDQVGGSGDPMPLGNFPLPAQQIALIRAWIDDGAQDN
jgi:hypothetical protein